MMSLTSSKQTGIMGWPNVKGFCNTPAEQSYCNQNDVVEPLDVMTPTLGVCGIAYYNHPAIPEWQHSVLMANLKGINMVHYKMSEDGKQIDERNELFENKWGRLRSVCVSPDGRVYIATSNRDGRTGWSTTDFPINADDRIIELHNPEYKITTVFSYSNSDSCRTIHFQNLTEDATDYVWDFGDGNTSTEANPGSRI